MNFSLRNSSIVGAQ